jgi:Tol biopolymer transport system component
MTPGKKDQRERVILGLTRKQRFRIYLGGAIALTLVFLVWSVVYLNFSRWYTYTDQVAFEQVARDVDLGYVVWEPAEQAGSGFQNGEHVGTPVISSNGARMIYSAGRDDGDANLFLREWDGRDWGKPRPLRALNSAFHEVAPSLSGDGELLYFTSVRLAAPPHAEGQHPVR